MSGADTASVEAAVKAMAPFVVGRDPWNATQCARTRSRTGSGSSAPAPGNFAWAGIDMALGTSAARPAASRSGACSAACSNEATYFFYLSRGGDESLADQALTGLAAGFDVFYLKVGLDERDDLRMVATLRDALGPGPRLRLDVNSNWSLPQALRMLERLAEHDIDFVEQPVRETPLGQLAEVRRRSPIAVCANEGLWSEADAYARIRCPPGRRLLPLAVLGGLDRSASSASHRWPSSKGLKICKHTHGELGIAAAAGPARAADAAERGRRPSADGADDGPRRPDRGAADRDTGRTGAASTAPGLGVEVDPDAVAEAAGRYRSEGQYLPWQPYLLGREERP